MSGPREILLNKEDEEKINNNPGWKKMYATYGVLLPDMDHMPDFTTKVTGEEQALAYEILAMCKDTERYQTYRVAGRERADRFSPERYAMGLKQILDRLDGGE